MIPTIYWRPFLEGQFLGGLIGIKTYSYDSPALNETLTTNIRSRGIIVIAMIGSASTSIYAGIGSSLSAVAEGANIKLSDDNAGVYNLGVADGFLTFKRVESSGFNYRLQILQLLFTE